MRQSLLKFTLVLGFCAASLAHPLDAFAECAWPNKTNRELFNVAFPDTSSTYWSHPYRLSPGAEIEISGEYVDGRYFSLNTYSLTGDSIDGLADIEIAPEAGSQNPFQNPVTTAAGGKRWRVVLRPGAAAKQGSNNLWGTRPDRARGWGVLIYRIYLPNDRRDEKAGVPLPVLTLRDGGSESTLAACENPGRSWAAEAVIRMFGPRANQQARKQPIFFRPESAEGFFPNRDTKYLAALTQWEPGRLVVVRGKAPATPDQMRYWSMCTNQYRQPWPVNACVADADIVRNASGDYTMVISTAGDRPSNATPENGINWLEWGPTGGTGIVLLRHMLPAPGFPYAVQHVKPGETGQSTMGPYYPVGRYCDRQTFEKQGPKGCW